MGHVWGNKDGGCDQNGCYGQYHFDDGCQFHMRTEFGEDGSMTQYKNGQVIEVNAALQRTKKTRSSRTWRTRALRLHPRSGQAGSQMMVRAVGAIPMVPVCCHQCGGPCTPRNQIWATATHLR